MLVVSIIIVTYNSFNEIGRCLESIYRQTDAVDVEAIVVDNFSTDLTIDVVKKYNRVRLIQNAANLGYATAVNKGFAESKGNFILILNPDTILHEDFLSRLSGILNESSQPQIIGFKLTDEVGRYQQSVWKTPDLISLFFEMFLPYKFYLKLTSMNPGKACEVQSISGACMLIHREVFNKINGFDERFFMYQEDLDFCLRARKSGYKVFINPDIKVVHYIAKSSWQDMQSFFLNIYKSKIYYFRKHYRTASFLLAFLLIIIGIKLRIVMYFIAGVLLFNKKLLRLFKYHIFVLKKIITRTNFIQ